MQTAETIVAVNRDPDAPIAEFADLRRHRRPVRGRARPPRRAPRPAARLTRGRRAEPGHVEPRSSSRWRCSSSLAALFLLVLRRAGRFSLATPDIERFRRAVARPRRPDRDVPRPGLRSASTRSARPARRRRARGRRSPPRSTRSALQRARRGASRPPSDGPPSAPTRRRARARRRGRSRWSSTARRSRRRARSVARELEAQTSIKRGYLNLLHAREADRPPGRGDAAAGHQRARGRSVAPRRRFQPGSLTRPVGGRPARPGPATDAPEHPHVVVSSRRHHKP